MYIGKSNFGAHKSREKYCDEKLKKFSNAFHLTKKSHFPQNDDEEENIIN